MGGRRGRPKAVVVERRATGHGVSKTGRENQTRSSSLKARKGKVFVATKASLGGRLLPNSPVELRDWGRGVIDDLTLVVSQRLVAASYVLDAALRRSMDADAGMPDISMNGIQKLLSNGPTASVFIKNAWAELFPGNDFAGILGATPGLAQVLKSSATPFHTCLANETIHKFHHKTRGLLKRWVRHYHPDAPKDMWYRMEQAVNGEDVGDLPEAFRAFVDIVRTAIVPVDAGDQNAQLEGWMRNTYALMRIRNAYNIPGGFSLVPAMHVKRHHIKIDSTALLTIIEKARRRFPHIKWLRRVV
jgi:hypothetical protein